MPRRGVRAAARPTGHRDPTTTSRIDLAAWADAARAAARRRRRATASRPWCRRRQTHARRAPDGRRRRRSTLPDVDGRPVSFDDLSGHKRVLVTWASWCGCRHELGGWEKLQQELADSGLRLFSVALDADPEDARPWIEAAAPSFPVAVDTAHVTAERYGITNVPSRGLGRRAGPDRQAARRSRPATTSSAEWTQIDSAAPPRRAARLGRHRRAPDSAGPSPSARTDDGQRALGERRIAAYLVQAGPRPIARRAHLAAARELAPWDWTVRRGGIALTRRRSLPGRGVPRLLGGMGWRRTTGVRRHLRHIGWGRDRLRAPRDRGQPAARRPGASPDGEHRVAPLPRRAGQRARPGDARQRRRLDRLARRHRDRPRAVRGRRPLAGPDVDVGARRSRSSTRASPTARCGRSTTTSSPSRSSTGSGGTPTSPSTSGSPPRRPRSPRRAPRSGCTTTSCSWCPRCCASCGPTCGSASTSTSRSRPTSCSSSFRGGGRSSRGCSAPTWSASSCSGGAANFVRLVRQRVGHKTHRDLVYLPDGRTVRAAAFPISIDAAGLRGARPLGVGRRARQGDPRGARQPRARSSSASTGSTTPRASTPGCARSPS